jgi:hypothetical protein
MENWRREEVGADHQFSLAASALYSGLPQS